MTTIQIKNVPEETHSILRQRAAKSHLSMQEYLLERLIADARRLDIEEWTDSVDGVKVSDSVETAYH